VVPLRRTKHEGQGLLTLLIGPPVVTSDGDMCRFMVVPGAAWRRAEVLGRLCIEGKVEANSHVKHGGDRCGS
jgi:hypothetical protein